MVNKLSKETHSLFLYHNIGAAVGTFVGTLLGTVTVYQIPVSALGLVGSYVNKALSQTEGNWKNNREALKQNCRNFEGCLATQLDPKEKVGAAAIGFFGSGSGLIPVASSLSIVGLGALLNYEKIIPSPASEAGATQKAD